MSADGVLRSTPMRRVASREGEPGAGVAEGGHGRCVLVISEDIELAVALRDRLDRAYVTVRDVRPAESAGAVRACRRWPWMVIGDGSDVPHAAVGLLARTPALLLWRGRPPIGLPHARRCVLYSEIAASAEGALGADVGGMRLAPGDGLSMPDGRHAASAALEVLVASHPWPVFAAARHFRCVDLTLEAHGVPLRLARTDDGGVHARRAGRVMRANAEVLLVEDDAETLEELRIHFSRKNFHPLATRSAAHAVSHAAQQRSVHTAGPGRRRLGPVEGAGSEPQQRRCSRPAGP